MRLREWVAGIVAAAVVVSQAAMVGQATPQPNAPAEGVPSPPEVLIGAPLRDPVRSAVQAQGVDAAGKPQAYWITDGKGDVPATFQVTDVQTGERLFAEQVPSGIVSYAIEFNRTEGAVYVAMTDGSWYRWKVGAKSLETLPRVDTLTDHAGAVIWALAAADDGTMYLGTNKARVASFNPATSTLADLGAPAPGESAIRAMQVVGDSVYVGTESNGRFVRVNRVTGEATAIPLPADLTGVRGIMTMARAGNLLLMRTRPNLVMLAYDTTTQSFVASFPNMDGVASGLDPTGTYFYYFDRATGVTRVDVATLKPTPLGNKPSAIPQSWAFVTMPGSDWEGVSVSFTFEKGRNYVNNYDKKASVTWMDDKLLSTAAVLRGLTVDGDGRVVVGGASGPGGVGVYDALTGRLHVVPATGGAQTLEPFGERVAYADTANGQLRLVDLDQAVGTGNPTAPLTIGSYQTQPWDMVALDEQTMLVGSAPGAGKSVGALTAWNTSTNTVSVWRGPVGNRSVTSVARTNGVTVVGSAIANGPGAAVTETSAIIVAVDHTARKVLGTYTPEPGAATISAITPGADGRLWAVADDRLLELTVDPTGAFSLVRSTTLPGVASTTYGEATSIVVRPDAIWVTAGGALWRVSVADQSVQQMTADGVSEVVEAGDGNLYFTRGTQLFRWTLAGSLDVTPPGAIPAFTGTRVASQAVSMGKPIDEITAIGGTVVNDPDGTPVIFSVTNGKPAVLNKINASTGRLIWAKELPPAGGSYAVVRDAKGDIYIGSVSSSGYFYRVRAGSDEVENLGIPVPGETFLWDLAVGDGGMIYGSTFPGAKLWSYDTTTGAVRDYGTLLEGAKQGRNVAYHEGMIYVGLMTPAKLYAVDVATGAKTEIPMPTGADTSDPMLSVFDVDVVDGTLYMRVGLDIKSTPLYAYDLATKTWKDWSVPEVSGLMIPDSDPNPATKGLLYVMSNGELSALDPATGTVKGTGLKGGNFRGVGWVTLDDPQWPGQTLTGLFATGQMWRYNPETGRTWLQPTAEVEVKGSQALLLELEPAARGGVWFGGYLAGFGHADLDLTAAGPEDARRNFGGSQTESLYDDGQRLWLGQYPDARVYSGPNTIDVQSQQMAWTMKNSEGLPQDRQPGVIANDRWVVGVTGPKLTSFGGSMGVIDRTTCGDRKVNGMTEVSATNCTYRKLEGLSPDRGFTSVTLDGDTAYATSWILGGTGAANPPQSEGQVIAYDLATGERKWAVSPVRGAKSYVGATVDSRGGVWALGETSVVQLDPATGKTMRIITMPGSQAITSQTFPALVGGMQLVPGTDRLLVKAASTLYEVSTATGEVINRGPFPYRAMAVNEAGLVFLTSDTELLKWQLPDMDVHRVLLSSDEIDSGDTVHINVDGFAPDERVEVWATPESGGAPRLLTTLTADRSGSTGTRLAVTLPGGTHRVVARGLTSGHEGTTTLSVVTAATPDPTEDPSTPAPSTPVPSTPVPSTPVPSTPVPSTSAEPTAGPTGTPTTGAPTGTPTTGAPTGTPTTTAPTPTPTTRPIRLPNTGR